MGLSGLGGGAVEKQKRDYKLGAAEHCKGYGFRGVLKKTTTTRKKMPRRSEGKTHRNANPQSTKKKNGTFPKTLNTNRKTPPVVFFLGGTKQGRVKTK